VATTKPAPVTVNGAALPDDHQILVSVGEVRSIVIRAVTETRFGGQPGRADGAATPRRRLSSMADEPRAYANMVCPYCALALDPLPMANKKCPACGRPIYVRSGPDGFRYLLQDIDLAAKDALWAEFDEQRADEAAVADNREAARLTGEALRSYSEAGLSSIGIIGAAGPCPACAAVAGRQFAIADAPTIPIPGCSNEICRCDYLPVIE
jgi:hypothetical protein